MKYISKIIKIQIQNPTAAAIVLGVMGVLFSMGSWVRGRKLANEHLKSNK